MSSYEPRTIAFGAEVLHPPMQLDTRAVQNIHNDLFQRPEVGYHNFHVDQAGVHLSNLSTTPGQVSSVTFQPDRTIIREEFRACTIEDFATRVVNVVAVSYQKLRIRNTIGQQFWVRSLVNPQQVHDSRVFVKDRLLAGGSAVLSEFPAPLHSAGIRLSFGQSEPTAPAINVRIEPWVQEPRSLWIEVIGQLNTQVPVDSLPDLGEGLYATYRFMTGPTLDYVDRFDRP